MATRLSRPAVGLLRPVLLSLRESTRPNSGRASSALLLFFLVAHRDVGSCHTCTSSPRCRDSVAYLCRAGMRHDSHAMTACHQFLARAAATRAALPITFCTKQVLRRLTRNERSTHFEQTSATLLVCFSFSFIVCELVLLPNASHSAGKSKPR